MMLVVEKAGFQEWKELASAHAHAQGRGKNPQSSQVKSYAPGGHEGGAQRKAQGFGLRV